jgi:hypothetical protein
LKSSWAAETTVEVGYLGAGGFHLQRSHLINNAQPGPGLIQPRRPFPKISFVPNTVFPAAVASTMTSSTFPATTINLLENTSQSWYDAGYVNVRRRASNRLSFLANYTFAKALENAPDFRSPMFEAATPQNNNDLNAEKGPGCDIRQRVAVSAVYNPPVYGRNGRTRALTRDWRGSVEYQVQTGFPMTISVFGDTANAGTVVGENPIRANSTGQKIFGSGTELDHMVQPRRIRCAARLHFWQCRPQLGLWPRHCRPWTWHWSAVSAWQRSPDLRPAPSSSTRSTTPTLEHPTAS